VLKPIGASDLLPHADQICYGQTSRFLAEVGLSAMQQGGILLTSQSQCR